MGHRVTTEENVPSRGRAQQSRPTLQVPKSKRNLQGQPKSQQDEQRDFGDGEEDCVLLTSDEEESKDDEYSLARLGGRSSDSGDSDRELAQTHKHCSVEEELSSTELLDHVDTRETSD